MVPFRQQLFVVFYTLALLGLVGALWFRPAVKDWPAWVQAVGSIAAIMAAVWIAQWQAGRERRDRLEDRREIRKAVAGLARRMANIINDHANTLITSPEYVDREGIDWSDLLLIDAALERFDPSELVSAEGVLAVEKIRRDAKALSHWERVVVEDHYGTEFHDFDVNDAVMHWRDRVQASAVALENLAA
jgi:hypothetical protein